MGQTPPAPRPQPESTDRDLQEPLEAVERELQRQTSLLEALWEELGARGHECFAVAPEELRQIEEESSLRAARIDSHIVNAVRC